jgi:hypothetical protein
MLTMALLGRHGRFGNQLFQYGFLRLYCQEHGLRYQVPEWIGQKLFGLRDEPITTILPFRPDIEGGLFPPFSGTPGDPPTINVDTIGSFEYTTARYAHHRALFRSFYQPIPALLDLVHPYSAALRAQHATLVAVHIRQGDAGVQNRLANIEIYRAELRKLWPTLSDPILFIATDGDRNAVRAFFEEFRQTPLIPAPVLPFEGANFYPDFYLLTQADVLLVSNSTFSYSASMLNTRAKRFIRPDAAGTTLYDFDPWNDLPLL